MKVFVVTTTHYYETNNDMPVVGRVYFSTAEKAVSAAEYQAKAHGCKRADLNYWITRDGAMIHAVTVESVDVL